jgi:Zn-dependent protease with chaperone function
LGLYLVARAGFDTLKAPELWRRMGASGEAHLNQNYNATHPSSPERAAALQQTIDEIRLKRTRGEPLLPAIKQN